MTYSAFYVAEFPAFGYFPNNVPNGVFRPSRVETTCGSEFTLTSLYLRTPEGGSASPAENADDRAL
jgi:hypothetical protein